MKSIVFRSIRVKLVVIFLVISLVPLSLMGYLAYHNFQKVLEKEAFSKLKAVAKIKKDHIESYFKERKRDLDVLAGIPTMATVLRDIRVAHTTAGSEFNTFRVSSVYSSIMGKITPYMRKYRKIYGYYDVFLMDRSGDIVWTAVNEADLGTNIKTGRYNDSNLADLLGKVLEDNVRAGFTDFRPYAPSADQPTAFFAHVVRDKEGGIQGAIALQLSVEKINSIMQEHAGLGETGVTYLVGPDLLMRSDSRFEEETTILKEKIDTAGTRDAFTRGGMIGEGMEPAEGKIYEDSRGNTVLGYNLYLKVLNWVVIAEIDEREALAPAKRIQRVISMTLFLIAAFAVVIAVIMSQKISAPIIRLSGFAGRTATGDLTGTITVKNKDEIGALAESFRMMTSGLSDILIRILNAVHRITTASGEILATSQRQAVSAREQSSAISETTSAAAELSKSAEQIGENIKAVLEAADHALAGMAKIKNALGKTNEVITSLSEKSQKIGQITELINDVTDQTNLLAVNAAVEAARAGEQGRGFSVVADEMRKLSDSTAKSTGDISGLIELVQHEISSAIISMEQSVANVDEEVRSAGETAKRAKEIAMSASQQISGSKQIADAMTNINEVMKQITSGAQQTQDAAKQLAHLADGLKIATEKFKIRKLEENAG